ncbi:hypothetical protein MBANPS3_010100 [Mucor bainieri]
MLYYCPDCDIVFRLKSSYASHKYEHHVYDAMLTLANGDKVTIKRELGGKFSCECGKSYSTRTCFQKHCNRCILVDSIEFVGIRKQLQQQLKEEYRIQQQQLQQQMSSLSSSSLPLVHPSPSPSSEASALPLPLKLLPPSPSSNLSPSLPLSTLPAPSSSSQQQQTQQQPTQQQPTQQQQEDAVHALSPILFAFPILVLLYLM